MHFCVMLIDEAGSLGSWVLVGWLLKVFYATLDHLEKKPLSLIGKLPKA